MKDRDKKFEQLYGKPPLFKINRHVYNNKMNDFCLGYKCGFDAAMEHNSR